MFVPLNASSPPPSQGVLADLDPSSDSIEVRLPYRALSDVLRELREAAPHALGTLGLASLEDELA